MASDLQNELSAMVQEMQNLEKALSDLDQSIVQISSKLHQIEAQGDGLVTAATNALAHHVTDLKALGQGLQTPAQAVSDRTSKAETDIQAEAQAASTSGADAFKALDDVKSHATTLHDVVVTHTTELSDEMHKFEDLVKGLEQSLNGRINAATETATAGVHELDELGQKWVQMAHTLASQIGDSLHHTADEVDQKYIAPLDDAIKQFDDLTKQIESAVLSNPIGALTSKLKDEILQEAQHIIDGVVQEVEKTLQDAIARLTESGESNDAVAKAMQEVFHEIEPAWNALTDALRSVQSIWDTVKSAVSVL